MNSINSNRAPEMGKSNVSLKASLMPWLISGYAIIGTVFLLLGGWAATAPIAKAVVAVGAVKVDTSRKRVQHQDGGTISEILVRDGDRVIAGQVLVRLDDTRSSASLGIVRSTYDAELARVARLESERDGRSEIQFPKELTDRKGDSKIDELLELQVELFNARRDSLKGSIEILTSQIAQLQERQRGIRSIVSAIDAQVKLVDDEMLKLEDLHGRGFVDQSRLRSLQIEKVRILGDRGESTSEITEVETAIAEKTQEIQKVRYDFNQAVADELRNAQVATLDYRERLDAAQYVVDNVEIRAPVDGIVVGLAVFAEGEVIRPGDSVLELVPLHEDLSIEAKVQLTDVDNLIVGQSADIRLTAFDSRSTPVLEGVVDYISADAFEDQRTGLGYYNVRVDISPSQLARLEDRELQPGMPADVIIKNGERTVLQYLYEPLSNALAKAWKEQ